MADQDPLRRPLAGYDEDFCRWSAEQAALIRAGRFRDLDIENVAEEIESLGRSDKREVRNRFEVLIEHLLKLAYSNDAEPRQGWRRTVREQRTKIVDLVGESPSLRPLLPEKYEQARKVAFENVREVLGAGDTVPDQPAFGLGDALDPAFWPGD